MIKRNHLIHISFLLLCGYFLWLSVTSKCNMSNNLVDLLGIVSEISEKHHITLWLCYGIAYNEYSVGSLLGYIRNNGLLPHDYDIDLMMDPNDYNKIQSLKNEFKKRGYSLYGKDDILPYYLYKKKMSIISFRLYNDKTHYFLELFDAYTVIPNQV